MTDPRDQSGERPLLPDDAPQDQQSALLRRTGNGPTLDNEEELLHAAFGGPDENGVYGVAGSDS